MKRSKRSKRATRVKSLPPPEQRFAELPWTEEDEAAADRAVERLAQQEAAERAAGIPQPPPFDVAGHKAMVAEIRARLAANGIPLHPSPDDE